MAVSGKSLLFTALAFCLISQLVLPADALTTTTYSCISEKHNVRATGCTYYGPPNDGKYGCCASQNYNGVLSLSCAIGGTSCLPFQQFIIPKTRMISSCQSLKGFTAMVGIFSTLSLLLH